jgi:hypothetical protein
MVNLGLFTLNTLAAVAIAKTLNITAIVGKNGSSTFECWALQPSLSVVHQPGLNGIEVLPLGALSNATYTVWPKAFKGGPHTEPTPEYVYFQPVWLYPA